MKYVFIVNPHSGEGKAREIGNKLENMCMDAGILDYEIYYTENKMDAAKFAQKHRDEGTVIFSIGGDGTINEVIQGMAYGKSKLEVIPAGSGNDFYRSLQTYSDKNQPCDLGVVNKEFFINTMSIGIDAEIGKNADLMKKKNVPPTQIYNASILYTLFNYKPKKLEIWIDGKPVTSDKDDIMLLSICNGTTYGGGFKIAPGAKIDDGLLDVYLVRNVSKSKLVYLITRLLKGTHESCPEMEHFKTDKIHVKSDDEIECILDGELIYDKDFKVTVLKDAITINNDKALVEEALKPKAKVYTK